MSQLLERWAGLRQQIGPIRLVSATPVDAATAICEAASSAQESGTHIHLANAYTVALADKSPQYSSVLNDKLGVNLPDGKPISWMSRLKRQSPRLNQVRGPQLFLDVCDLGRSYELRHVLLGSTPEVLDLLQAELRRRFPGIDIAEAISPPFRPLSAEELEAQDGIIRKSRAQIVWVGLGTPKQDVEALRLAAALPVLAIAVGAAFDFTAGTLKVAPHWMSSLGLEWVFRFASEPRRLWKRYVFGNVRFLKAVLLPTKVA